MTTLHFWRSRFVYEVDGAAGGSAPPSEPPATSTPPGDAPPAPPASTPADFFYATEVRPDGLSDTFYDVERKGIRVDALAQSYRELQGRFSQKNDALKAELAAAARAGVPETPEGYAFTLPKDLIPEGFEAQSPPDDDPMLSEARKVFHELGAKPEQWDRMLGAFVKWQVSQAPDLEAARAAVGENAPERIAAVDMWLARVLPEPQYRAVTQSATSAPFLLAMEALMTKATGGQGVLPTGVPGGGEAGMTPDEAREAMLHPDYGHQSKGAELRAKVYAFLEKGGRIPRTVARTGY